jgi:hypothetical protein
VGQPGCNPLLDRRRARTRRAQLRRDWRAAARRAGLRRAAWDQGFTDAEVRLPDGTTCRTTASLGPELKERDFVVEPSGIQAPRTVEDQAPDALGVLLVPASEECLRPGR